MLTAACRVAHRLFSSQQSASVKHSQLGAGWKQTQSVFVTIETHPIQNLPTNCWFMSIASLAARARRMQSFFAKLQGLKERSHKNRCPSSLSKSKLGHDRMGSDYFGKPRGGIFVRNVYALSPKLCQPRKLYLPSKRLAGRRDHWRSLRGSEVVFALREP